MGEGEVEGKTEHLDNKEENNNMAPRLSRKRPWAGALRRTSPVALLVVIVAACSGPSSSSFYHAAAFHVADDVQRSIGDNSADTAHPGIDDPAAVRLLLDGDERGRSVPCEDVDRNRGDPCNQDRMLNADLGLEVGEPNGFFELARERFVAREGRAPTSADEQWTFPHVQLIRVPKAASTAVSVVARELAGCVPHGPCCRYPGDPRGSCPAKGLICDKVTGCAGHSVNGVKMRMLSVRTTFSMSNLRDVAGRIISAFFYTAPHSPACARAEVVDYVECFRKMVDMPTYQNVAARMFTGNYAYAGTKKLCVKEGPHCQSTLDMAIKNACNFNVITITEAWSSSMLLLFETIPWKAPTQIFFPKSSDARRQLGTTVGVDVEVNSNISGAELPVIAEEELAGFEDHHMRKNTGQRHEEGIGYITTPELMDLVREKNPVDVLLHDFVIAKFCHRLRELGLIDHPLVVKELTADESLGKTCYDEAAIQATLGKYDDVTTRGEKCRLFQPLSSSVFM